MTEYGLVLMTASSDAEAEKIAEHLVAKKLAACVNILPGVKSLYRWEGKICKENEILMIAKIKTAHYKELEQAIMNIHSYDVPEIVLIPIVEGASSYLDWIGKVTKA